MFKTALFDCAINEKCCSVDGGRGICHPREFAIQGPKECKCPGSARMGGGAGGGGWAQLELTDALSSLMYSITVLCKTLSFCPLVILCFSEGFSPTEWVSSYSLEIEVGSSNNDNACLISSFFSHCSLNIFIFLRYSLLYLLPIFRKKNVLIVLCPNLVSAIFSSYPD